MLNVLIYSILNLLDVDEDLIFHLMLQSAHPVPISYLTIECNFSAGMVGEIGKSF